MTAWIALFCPNCYTTLNEEDLEEVLDHEIRTQISSPFTCGWCHTRQRDWGHVKVCRHLTKLRERAQHEQAAQETLGMFLTLLRRQGTKE